MRIVIASTPIAGHLDPVLGLARALVADEHEVVVYTGSTLRDRVAAVGAQFEALPPEVDFDLRDVDRCFPARRQLDPVALALHDFGKVFIGSMPAQYRGLRTLLDRFPADCIIVEHCFYGVVPFLVSDRLARPPIIGCGISYLPLDRDDGLPHGLGLPFATDPMVRDEHRATFLPVARAVSEPLQAIYDQTLRQLDLEPDGSAMSVLASHADAFLQAGVPELDYPHADLPAHVRFAGRWPSGPTSTPLPDWAADLDGHRSVILVTQGTVANDDLEYLVLPTLRSLADRDDLLVVATAGGRDVNEFEAELPANARIASYLPFDWLIPRVSALVTNGGYGTVTQALAEGIPIVVAGTTEDKAEIAARVEWSGAGIDLKTHTPSDHALRDSIHSLLDNPVFRTRAQEIAASFRRLNCADILRETLERIRPARAIVASDARAATE